LAPEQIESRFAIEMTHLADRGRSADRTGGAVVQGGDVPRRRGRRRRLPTKQAGAPGGEGEAGPLTMATSAQMDFDGNIEFTVGVRASRATPVEDIRLEIPIAADVARFLMGLGFKGGKRPASLDWKWEVKNNQDSAWIGDINAGLQFTLKDDKYVRPLNTNFYTQAAGDAGVVVQRRQGRVSAGGEGSSHLPCELLQRRTDDRAG
jgi:hypothetical protein